VTKRSKKEKINKSKNEIKKRKFEKQSPIIFDFFESDTNKDII
jgi:hypothetical protein